MAKCDIVREPGSVLFRDISKVLAMECLHSHSIGVICVVWLLDHHDSLICSQNDTKLTCSVWGVAMDAVAHTIPGCRLPTKSCLASKLTPAILKDSTGIKSRIIFLPSNAEGPLGLGWVGCWPIGFGAALATVNCRVLHCPLFAVKLFARPEHWALLTGNPVRTRGLLCRLALSLACELDRCV